MSLKAKFFQLLFILSMLLKFLDGLLEFVGGMAFLLLKKKEILNLLSKFLNIHAFHIPNAIILSWLTKISQSLTLNVEILIMVMLIGNGVIKMILAVNLLKKKMFVFPLAITFLIILLLYQCVQLYYMRSLYLLIVNIIDAIVIFVIWREYVILKRLLK